MNSTMFPIRTLLPLDAKILGGNPDHLEVLPDFATVEQQREVLDELTADLAAAEGAFTAAASRRLAESSCAVAQRVDGVPGAMVTLRAVALVRRPSLRVAGITLGHLSLSTECIAQPEGPLINLRISAPMLHRNAAGDRTEALEGVLHHLLDQVDGAVTDLLAQTDQAQTATIMWQLPSNCPMAEFVTELNERLFTRFYVPLLPYQRLAA